MTDTAWIRRLCSTDDSRPALVVPIVVPIDGAPHTIATNGWVCLALPGVQSGAAPFPFDVPAYTREKFDATVAGHFALADVPARALAFPALRAFVRCESPIVGACAACGDRRSVTCPDCDGRGHTNWIDCDGCYGAGDIDCPTCMGALWPTDPVRIGCSFYNRHLLARALRQLAGEVVTFRQRPGIQSSLFEGDGWRLAVMPLNERRLVASEQERAPVFDGWLDEPAAVTS